MGCRQIPQSDILLLIDGPITAQSEQQEHFFNKQLTVCGTYSQQATCVSSSLLMVYAFMFTSNSPSLLFNFTFSFGAVEIYIAALAACGVCCCRLCLSPLCRGSRSLWLLTFSCVRTTVFVIFIIYWGCGEVVPFHASIYCEMQLFSSLATV